MGTPRQEPPECGGIWRQDDGTVGFHVHRWGPVRVFYAMLSVVYGSHVNAQSPEDRHLSPGHPWENYRPMRAPMRLLCQSVYDKAVCFVSLKFP